MRRPRFPFAKSYTDHRGKTRWRYQPKGGRGWRREIGPDFGSEDFARRYAEAEAEFLGTRRAGVGAGRAAPGTFNALAASYYKSPAWRALSDSTKATYRGVIDAFLRDHGTKRVATLRPAHVAAILAAKADTPGAANNLRKRLAQLLDHAIRSEWITTNPARATQSFRTSGTGFHTWTEQEIASFFAAHAPGTMAHTAVTLMLYTGAARADAVRLGPWNLRDTAKGPRIEYRRLKTARSGGVLISIPVHPDLAAVLAGLPQDRPFLATAYGKPRTAAGLGNAFRAWCDAAGLPACSSHGLRKAIARRLAEAGATVAQIAGVTGHKTLSEIQRYTAAADRELAADQGFDLLLARPNGEQTLVNMQGAFTKKTTNHLKRKDESR